MEESEEVDPYDDNEACEECGESTFDCRCDEEEFDEGGESGC